MAMEEMLDRLDFWLQQHRSSYYHRLLPGLTEVEIHTFEEAVGCILPESVKAFYRWHNGDWGDRGEGVLGTTGRFLPVDSILRTKAIITAKESSRGDLWLPDGYSGPDEWWNPSWIPFFEWNSDVLCLDLTGAFNGEKGQIIRFSPGDYQTGVYHPNFE